MNSFYSITASLLAHLGLLAAMYFAFDRAPELLLSRRGRASLQLVASVASSGEQQKQVIEIRIEPPRPPVEPPPELEAATPERVRRPPEMPAVRQPGDLPLELPKLAENDVEATTPDRELTELAVVMVPPKPLPRAEVEPPPPATQVEAAASAASPASQAFAGAEVDEMPLRAPVNQAPAYPAEALAAGQQGRVTLRVKLTAAGAVGELDIHATSGTASLDAAAVAAVRSWRFSPARRRGVAVPMEVLVPVRFSIRGR